MNRPSVKESHSSARSVLVSRLVRNGALAVMATLLLSGCSSAEQTPNIIFEPTDEVITADQGLSENNDDAALPDAQPSIADAKTSQDPEDTDDFSDPSKETVERPTAEEIQEAIDDAMPGMDCWGDSITEGFLGDGVTWPATFSELLDERIIKPIREATGYDSLNTPVVRNMGVSTETVPEITGRRGAVPFVLTKDVTIPADKTAVNVEFASSNRGQTTKPLRYGDGTCGENGVNPVTIAGISGTLTRYFDPALDSSRYLFERITEGAARDVSAGEEVVTGAAGLYSDDLCVVMMGANGGYKDADDLADQFEKMASMQRCDRYLLIGMGCTPVDSGLLTPEEEAVLSDRFGEHFISLQKWMSEHGIEYANEYLDADIEISEREQSRIDKGYTPYCLLNEDGLHYTPDGYKVIAYMIFDEMRDRGYFKELEELSVSYAAQTDQNAAAFGKD